jgi:hypothetical protein
MKKSAGMLILALTYFQTSFADTDLLFVMEQMPKRQVG